MSQRMDIPYAFERMVYDTHSEAIIAAVHDVMPEEHYGRLCDAICASVGRMVVGVLFDESRVVISPGGES